MSVPSSIPGDFANHGSKNGRHSVLARWLIETFGQTFLREGTGVLDVAGGSGSLSFELSTRFGIPCTVVDPRDIKLNTIIKKRMRKISEMRSRNNRTEHNKNLPDYLKADESLDDGHILDIVWDAIYKESVLPFHHIQKEFEYPFIESEDNQLIEDIIASSSAIVGCHPDQATGAIVDAAVAMNKPFAILPCCVFAELFNTREIDGRAVRTYEDLIDWLALKSPGIRVAHLPFEGRNKVLYRL